MALDAGMRLVMVSCRLRPSAGSLRPPLDDTNYTPAYPQRSTYGVAADPSN